MLVHVHACPESFLNECCKLATHIEAISFHWTVDEITFRNKTPVCVVVGVLQVRRPCSVRLVSAGTAVCDGQQ